MIEINLLPEEKRIRQRKKPVKQHTDHQHTPVVTAQMLKKVFYAVPVIAGLFLCVHAYCLVAQVSASMQLAALNKKWRSLEPQRANLTGFKSTYEAGSQDEKVLGDLPGAALKWSKKLNRLSLDLPSGIWLSELSGSPFQMVAKCSVVSLENDQVEMINTFITGLRNDADFFGDFLDFDLGSVQKRAIGTYEIADFMITLNSKKK